MKRTKVSSTHLSPLVSFVTSLYIEKNNVKQFTEITNESSLQLAQDSIYKINENDRIPPEVERIVRQHHGTTSGIGFPSKLSPQAKKPSIAFMMAEEFSFAILRSSRAKINVKGVINQITEKFPESSDVLISLAALKMALSGKK
jgi:hypothetical protein